ncbi:MAG: metallophosphoesterase [Chlorobiales bacterium]|nr:metallophosphoesterase [Chlorobiales bacterium]
MQTDSPLFSFGVVTDIQYADIDDCEDQRFRQSPHRLEKCVSGWNNSPIAFAVQLGDIVQGNEERTYDEFEQIASILDTVKAPLYHVIGNHCLDIKLPDLLSRFGMQMPYYDFTYERFRFIVLYGMEISVHSEPKDGSAHQFATRFLAENPGFKAWTGAVSNEQLDWLDERLKLAAESNERVIILNHFPVTNSTTSEKHGILWNHEEVTGLITSSGVVVAHINGHYHNGAYALQNGTHYVTLESLVETPGGDNSYGIVEVYDDKLVINGAGVMTSRVLQF